MVHTCPPIRIGLLGMDVQNIEETAVAHQVAHAYHRTVIGLGGVVLQEIERRTIAKAHSIHLRQLQQLLAIGLALRQAQVIDSPGFQDILVIVAQRLLHLLTDIAAEQQGYSEHHDGKHSLNHHQHMTPALAHTATESATNDIDGLVAAKYRGGHKTCQRPHQSYHHHKTNDGQDASILEQVYRTSSHLDSLILQGECQQIGYSKGNGGEEDTLTYQLEEHLQARQT